ncbi:MAG: hypothetical protein K5922_03840 [Clostridiales bacterium]|nr:hypothetical protein [Clostridiales bacterium]
MVIPSSCRDIINRERINERCEPNLEGYSLREQVRYFQTSCSYLVDIIINLLRVVQNLELETSQPPSGDPDA